MMLIISNREKFIFEDEVRNIRDLQLAFISNRTTKRFFQILSTMERARLFTIGELAEKIKVTQRTIASDIKYIKDYFGDCITLVSGSSGFLFEEKKPSIYQEKKQEFLENECLFELIGEIFKGSVSEVDELAHRYHFSETTFRRLLGNSATVLASYGLQWSSSPLTIEGSEANLRKFFKDFYYEGIDTTYTLVPDPELHELILNQLNNKLGQYEIGSGTTPAAFSYTFYIAIKRASFGFPITISKDLAELAYKGKSFSLLYSLNEGIKRLYGIELAKEEFAWIYLVTICKRTLDQTESEKKFYKQFHQGSEIAQLTDAYLNVFELAKDSRSQIKIFLQSFFLSRKVNHLLSPVLNKEAQDIKEALMHSDNENYERNLRFLKENQRIDFLDTPYIEDICVSLTIYSDLIFDFYSREKNIYFLLEGDHFICQQIRTRAIQQFGTKHTLTFLPFQHLTQEILNEEHIDLIVTNYNRYLLDFIIETDYLLLKAVPDEQDWQRLERKIDPYRKPFF